MFNRMAYKIIKWPNSQAVEGRSLIELKTRLLSLGLKLDLSTGQLYQLKKAISMTLNFELILIRHGETYGNCGQSTENGKIDHDRVKANIKDKDKRIFQGNVDTEINQLTEFGRTQAKQVAAQLIDDYINHAWVPDVVLLSPLTRAIDTARPFIDACNYHDRSVIHHGITEMSFGVWENRRVCDLPAKDPCHLFYETQHALIKNSEVNHEGIQFSSECFSEVLLRASNVLHDMNKRYAGKKIIMFSHSMFGAALCILLGKGQKFENAEYLAFDGKRSDGSYYTIPNAQPFPLNVDHHEVIKMCNKTSVDIRP